MPIGSESIASNCPQFCGNIHQLNLIFRSKTMPKNRRPRAEETIARAAVNKRAQAIYEWAKTLGEETFTRKDPPGCLGTSNQTERAALDLLLGRELIVQFGIKPAQFQLGKAVDSRECLVYQAQLPTWKNCTNYHVPTWVAAEKGADPDLREYAITEVTTWQPA
jgi:hypothetical protein